MKKIMNNSFLSSLSGNTDFNRTGFLNDSLTEQLLK